MKISDTLSISESPSIIADLDEISKDFENLNLTKYQSNDNIYNDITMSSPLWYEEYINDLNESDDENENNSTFDCEDIIDITKSVKITGKIIKNAIESEKTFSRYFNLNSTLVPNKE